MASIRAPLAAQVTLATKDDLDGTIDGSQYLDVSGDEIVVIEQRNDGTAGTAGIDVVEFSRDGVNFLAATAANIKGGHAGLLKADGTAAASAALNAAGVEPTTMGAMFFLGPIGGPCKIRLARLTTTTSGTTWVTGAPSVVANRVGGAGAISVTEPN